MQVDNLEAKDSMISEVRESVAKLCGDFQGDYWRKLDREQAYPTEFVKALTDAGFLGALIPEEYGGWFRNGCSISNFRGNTSSRL